MKSMSKSKANNNIHQAILFIAVILFNFSAYGKDTNTILEKHFDSIGGLQNITQLQSIKKEREIILKQVGATIKSELLIKKNDGLKVHLFPSSVSQEKIELLVKGTGHKREYRKTTDLSKQRLKYFSKVLKDFPSPFLEGDFTYIKQENVNGVLAYLLQRSDGNLYWINSMNYRLVKSLTDLYHDELGWLKITTIYSNYKEVEGLWFPFTEEILEYNQQIEIINIQLNVPTNDLNIPDDSNESLSNTQQNHKLIQKNPDEIAQQIFEETKSYYAALESLKSYKNSFDDNPMMKSYFFDIYSTILANAGSYKKALEARDSMNASNIILSNVDIDLNEFKAVNAIKEIENLADQHKAIFINEAHHAPQHRLFTHQLLKTLYDKGFRYFAAETLTEDDVKKLHLHNTIHSYINEPEYADLLRTAKRIGYTIISYEQENALYVNSSSSIEDQKRSIIEREIAQAQNLKHKIFEKDKNAKVVVHAGYDHILEKEHFGYKMMAARFKELTGINPLTIDQVGLMEKGDFKLSDPNYQHIIKYLNPKDFIVLKNDRNQYFRTLDRLEKVDIQVVHPKTHYTNGRPNWKSLGGQRNLKTVMIPSSIDNGVAEVYLKDDKSGIPIDRVLLYSKKHSIDFYLPSGDFKLKITDKNGKTKLDKELFVN